MEKINKLLLINRYLNDVRMESKNAFQSSCNLTNEKSSDSITNPKELFHVSLDTKTFQKNALTYLTNMKKSIEEDIKVIFDSPRDAFQTLQALKINWPIWKENIVSIDKELDTLFNKYQHLENECIEDQEQNENITDCLGLISAQSVNSNQEEAGDTNGEIHGETEQAQRQDISIETQIAPDLPCNNHNGLIECKVEKVDSGDKVESGKNSVMKRKFSLGLIKKELEVSDEESSTVIDLNKTTGTSTGIDDELKETQNENTNTNGSQEKQIADNNSEVSSILGVLGMVTCESVIQSKFN